MVGHSAMPPERVPMPATMTRSEEEAARKKLDDYFLDTGGKLLAVASLERPLRRGAAARPTSGSWPRASSGTPISWPTSSPSRTSDAISRVADELVERRELNGDEITELMDSLHLKPAVVDYLEERTWPRL